MAFSERLTKILDSIGQAAAEVTASFDTHRTFVGIWRFDPSHIPGGTERYAYLGSHQTLYNLQRFEVYRKLIEDDCDVHPEQLLSHQSIVVADLSIAEAILLTWLSSLEELNEPRHCDIRYSGRQHDTAVERSHIR